MKQAIMCFAFLLCAFTGMAQEAEANILPADTLSVPLIAPVAESGSCLPFSMYAVTPFHCGYASWQLHEGLNASFGMSVTFSPSKYAPSGAGFGQDAAVFYARPLNKRFSMAAGLYASNMSWGGLNYRNVGFAAIAGFRVNERVSLYAYGTKSLMPKRKPFYHLLPNFDPDRIGGMVNFKLGESSSFSFGVEGLRYPGIR